MTTITLAEAVAKTGKDVLDHLDQQCTVPIVTRFACQGDVAILADADTAPATTPIPDAGVVAVASEASSNTHSLHGAAFYDRRESGMQIGVLTVPDGSEALLMHPEHGAMWIAPGSYSIRRQREQADELRLVAD